MIGAQTKKGSAIEKKTWLDSLRDEYSQADNIFHMLDKKSIRRVNRAVAQVQKRRNTTTPRLFKIKKDQMKKNWKVENKKMSSFQGRLRHSNTAH